MIAIRAATASDAEAVTALAFRSKAVWGYPEEMMTVFRDELRVDGAQLVAHGGHVAEVNGVIVGYYMLVAHSAAEVELEHLFVEPERMRTGIGTALLEHARHLAAERGFRRLITISDPHAEGFYLARGGVETGRHQSEFPGRTLPILALPLVE